MKVRILSGNQKGAVVEMPQTEAEVNIATGYAEAVAETKTAVIVPQGRTKPTHEREK